MLRRLGDLSPLAQSAVGLALVLALVAVVVHSLGLLPPRSLTIAAGREGGGYDAVAERYRGILAEDDIDLVVVETAGSVENAALLRAGEVDVALLQGGVELSGADDVEALAAVFLEPVLVFYRGEVADAVDPSQWRHLKVAGGEPGSGTRAAMQTAIRTLDLQLSDGMLTPLGGADAAEALLAGEVDVAVFVAPIDAPYLTPLLHDDRIAIAPIRDSEALSRRLPYVRMVDIPPAGIDYARRIPEQRVALVAMIASLVASDDLHPALVDRLIRAAQRVHATPSIINDRMRFPTTEGLALPVNAQAAAALRSGPTTLDRLLPFWVSAQISQIALLLLPTLLLLLPVMRLIPGVYRWRMHARVYRRYGELLAIEREASDAPLPRRRELLERLEAIDREARGVRVPVRFREYVYTLRLHIDLVRRKLLERDATGDAAAQSTAWRDP